MVQPGPWYYADCSDRDLDIGVLEDDSWGQRISYDMLLYRGHIMVS